MIRYYVNVKECPTSVAIFKTFKYLNELYIIWKQNYYNKGKEKEDEWKNNVFEIITGTTPEWISNNNNNNNNNNEWKPIIKPAILNFCNKQLLPNINCIELNYNDSQGQGNLKLDNNSLWKHFHSITN